MVLPFLSHCLQSRGSREEACCVLSHLSKDGLRPPKVNKEARPLDFSKCGLRFRLLSQKLSKIKALAGATVLASGPAPGMCLGQVPPHASLSSQAGPHLMLLIRHWPDTEFAQAVAKDSPRLTFKSTYKWMASQTLAPLQGPRGSPRPSHSTGFPMVTRLSAFGISCLGVEVCFGCRPGNCSPLIGPFVSLFTVLFYLRVTLRLAALAEGGGLVCCTPTRVCQQNLGASHRLLSCQAGADTLAEAEWGRADKWEGSLSSQREVSEGVYGRGPFSPAQGAAISATFVAPRPSGSQSRPPAGM